MSIVNLYKNITDTQSQTTVHLIEVLNWIKDGKWKTQVEYYRKMREQYGKGHENEAKTKKMLPYFTVSGTFEERANDKLVEHSGFVAVDIDPGGNPFLNDADKFLETRDRIIADKYTYACFASCSGKGFCVVMAVDPEEHFEIFTQIEAYYKHVLGIQIDYLADVSRARFVSYDRGLFINDDAFPFEFGCEPSILPHINSNGHSTNVTKLLDKSRPESAKEIFEFAQKITESYISFEPNYRHKFVVQLAKYCNRMGLNQAEATEFIYEKYPHFAQNPSNAITWEYNNGTKRHNDWKWKTAPGGGVDKEEEETVWQQYEKYPFIDSFEKKDEVIYYVDKFQFIIWLHEELGFGLTFRNGNPIYIRVSNNIIRQFSREEILSFVYTHLSKDPHVQKKVANSKGLMSADKLLELPNLTDKIQPTRDPKDKSYFFFKNGFYVVDKNGPGKMVSYDELDFLIWESDIIQKVINYDPNYMNLDFSQFMLNISGKDEGRRDSLFSVMGYMLHTYKDRAKAKSIVLVDENSDFDSAQGGTGKSLLSNALGYVRSLVREDGKSFDRKNVQFLFQNVSESTKIFCLDDVTKYFKWDRLFSVITEGIIVEKKGKDPFEIPFSESPKLLITTNYMVRNDDSSTRRRFIEIEIFNHYSDKHTPIDEFGKVFFDDWSQEEWNQFYSLMMYCFQVYINKGIEVYISPNRGANKFKTVTSGEFFDFCDGRFEIDQEYDMRTEFEDFKEINTQYKSIMKRNTFIKWLKEYAKFREWSYSDKWTNHRRDKRFWFHASDMPF